MSARRRPSSPSWVANIPRRRARASPSESGSTPDHGAHLEHLSLQHDLDHQIGSDISRSNDRYLQLLHLLVLPKGTGLRPDRLLTRSERGPCQYRRFWLRIPRPFAHTTIGPNAPVSTTSPARSGSPALASFRTSQRAASKDDRGSGSPTRPHDDTTVLSSSRRLVSR